MTFQRTLIALSLFATGAAFAQTADPATHTPRIDKREARQEQRINQGVASGSLTEREAARLNKGQAHIDNKEVKAEADGTVTRKERAKLTHAQNKQDRHIKRQKHDRQTVTPAG